MELEPHKQHLYSAALPCIACHVIDRTGNRTIFLYLYKISIFILDLLQLSTTMRKLMYTYHSILLYVYTHLLACVVYSTMY